MVAGVFRIYGSSHSSSSWRVRIALALKGIEAEAVDVNVRRGSDAQDDPAFGELNPTRQIPVLVWEEGGQRRALGQSMAILRYLEAVRPEPALWPGDPYLAALATQLAELVNSGIQPLQNNRVLGRLEDGGVDSREWGRWAIERGLAALEASAAPHAGDFLVGDQPSVADLYAVPQLYNARRFDVNVAAFPTLLHSEESCMKLEAFRKTHPDG
jgi:maleylpyruvate isomerase